MTYPTISVSLNDDRLTKLSNILRKLREQEETISRSEAIGRAIDHFYPIMCPLENTSAPSSVQKEAA